MMSRRPTPSHQLERGRQPQAALHSKRDAFEFADDAVGHRIRPALQQDRCHDASMHLFCPTGQANFVKSAIAISKLSLL